MTIFDPYKEQPPVPTSLDVTRPTQVAPGLTSGRSLGQLSTDPELRYRSGILSAIGTFLGWASVLVPGLLVALLILTVDELCAVEPAREFCSTSGARQLGLVIPIVMATVTAILAALGRRAVRRRSAPVGAVWLILAAGVLIYGVLWVRDTTGLPLF